MYILTTRPRRERRAPSRAATGRLFPPAIMASSLPPDVAGLRHRLSSFKHQQTDTNTHQLGRRDISSKMAPHNPSVKAEGEDDTSGEYPVEMIDDGEGAEEDGDSVMYSLPSTASSSNVSGGAAEGGAKPKMKGSHSMNSVGGGRFGSTDELGRRPPTLRSHRKKKPEIEEPTSRWFGYDLSIIVALVSPIGNMLTGGDHVKNILLILLLIYYLYQLVEGEHGLFLMDKCSCHPYSAVDIVQRVNSSSRSRGQSCTG